MEDRLQQLGWREGACRSKMRMSMRLADYCGVDFGLSHRPFPIREVRAGGAPAELLHVEL